ncbi:MAG: class II glutamine amidotransferase, partial [Clostridiales bacterium]|nr:class II glutamine amidotransferase [Clostridiales bacterium]
MCELFGACSKYPLKLNEYIKEFYSHSSQHPHGCGLALLNGAEALIEKEPIQADKSHYLHERLTVPIADKVVLGHIRYATIGNIEYRNCHPYTGKDITGRRWTLIHNGTIFKYDPLNKYVNKQQGDTDSERILLYLLDQINQQTETHGILDSEVRFRVLDAIFCDMAEGNKLNFLIYDGECLYVHTNYEGSLHFWQEEGRVMISTSPLRDGSWKPFPMTTLLAFKDGELLYTGTNHHQVY